MNWDSFKWRNHQPDIGRFFNVDPIADSYTHNSPYAFAENSVIRFIELEGLEKLDCMVALYKRNLQPYGGYPNFSDDPTFNKTPNDVSISTADQALTFRLDMSDGTLEIGNSKDWGEGIIGKAVDLFKTGDPHHLSYTIENEASDGGMTVKGTINDTAFEISVKLEGDKITVNSTLEKVPEGKEGVISMLGARDKSPAGVYGSGNAINSTPTEESNSNSSTTHTYRYTISDGQTTIDEDSSQEDED